MACYYSPFTFNWWRTFTRLNENVQIPNEKIEHQTQFEMNICKRLHWISALIEVRDDFRDPV